MDLYKDLVQVARKLADAEARLRKSQVDHARVLEERDAANSQLLAYEKRSKGKIYAGDAEAETIRQQAEMIDALADELDHATRRIAELESESDGKDVDITFCLTFLNDEGSYETKHLIAIDFADALQEWDQAYMSRCGSLRAIEIIEK